MDISAHEIADLFPSMSEEEYKSLKESISSEGLLEPVWLYDGKILDGRHRYRACQELGVQPDTRVFDGSESEALALALALNLDRRHMSTDQKAALAAEIEAYESEQIGGQGSRTDLTSGNNSTSGRARKKAAEKVSTNPRYVSDAKKIRQDAPDVFDRMKEGRYGSMADAKRVAELDTDTREQVNRSIDQGEEVDTKTVARKAKRKRSREQRTAKIKEQENETPGLEELDRRFGVVLADPPWSYDFSRSDSRKVENQYPTLQSGEIGDFPVGEIVTNDSILFLWTTSPKLQEGMQVMRQWGFAYKTCLVWDKKTIGMGYYARSRHELLLVGKRGEIPPPEPDSRPESVIRAKRGPHSKKPDEVYAVIERMYPDLSKIELFARSKRDGWTSWGNQV